MKRRICLICKAFFFNFNGAEASIEMMTQPIVFIEHKNKRDYLYPHKYPQHIEAHHVIEPYQPT